MFYQSIEHSKPCVVVLFALDLYHKANKKAKAMDYTVIKHSGYLRTFEENTHM